MSSIETTIAEIESLALGEKLMCRKIAAKHGVERTKLARRHQAKNLPRTVKGINQKKLTPAQEHELILYINRQCERGIPPLRGVV